MQLKSVIKPDILVVVTNEESKKLWSGLYVILGYLEVSTESLADSLLHYTGISGSSFYNAVYSESLLYHVHSIDRCFSFYGV